MTTNKQDELRYNARKLGKSFKAWNQFIAHSRLGVNIAYLTPEGDICSPARVKKLIDAEVSRVLSELEKESKQLTIDQCAIAFHKLLEAKRKEYE